MIMSVFLFQASAQQLPAQELPESPEYSDEELLTFVQAAIKVMPLQQESQMKMVAEIEEENLTVEKFNDIMQSFSNGENANTTEEEIIAFNNAMEGIQEIQVEYEEVITRAIAEEGITPAKYEEIMTHYQFDPELQMRINQIIGEMQETDEN